MSDFDPLFISLAVSILLIVFLLGFFFKYILQTKESEIFKDDSQPIDLSDINNINTNHSSKSQKPQRKVIVEEFSIFRRR